VYYRLYLIRNERFRDAIDIHAANDDAALMEAEHQAEGMSAELWCRGRRVANLLAASAA
jgi:hypothetical protein